MVLSQIKSIKDLLIRVNMVEENGVSTPMSSSCKLNKHDEDKLLDPLLYRSTVGTLQYVILTRPDIAFCVNKAFQFMAGPLESH